ncbi:Major intracellular serine protease [Cytospora mali]|uniref:Major intracellular serine protease n=1 Tax=Cytospora mali TaxID=578113 RepID=A0A194W8R2_CYTMA|nr:Major intracellular serine protease [Valsa mali]
MAQKPSHREQAKAMLQKRQANEVSITPARALQNLFDPKDQGGIEKQSWLKALNAKVRGQNLQVQREITSMHEYLAKQYHDSDKENETDQNVLHNLLDLRDKPPSYKLKYLFSSGQEGLTILHVILKRSTYPFESNFQFSRMKPLIRFLLRIHPELPAVTSTDSKGPPIFMALETQQTTSGGPLDKDEKNEDFGDEEYEDDEDEEEDGSKWLFSPSEKEEIVRFLCEKHPDGLGSGAAIKSLAQMVYSSDPSAAACHAIHRAVESSDFRISEDVLKELSKIKIQDKGRGVETPCLMMRDGQGRTCLHIALTAAFREHRTWWAEKLTVLHPDLLQTASTIRRNGKEESLTPLQHFSEQKVVMRPESRLEFKMPFKTSLKTDSNTEVKMDQGWDTTLESLEAFLKRQCLMKFDSDTCKRIMYKKENAREIFLTLEDDTISWDLLESQKRHYKLDTLLKRLHICDSVSVHWDESSDASLKAHDITKKWGCSGNVDLFLVFYWLKTENKVKKILEVEVDDGAKRGTSILDPSADRKKPHSDQAIIECLNGLGVETLNWQRLDIPAEVIVEGAGLGVKKLWLYCSGLQAVLQSWADTQGLAKLENQLEEVHVEINQGLESVEWTKIKGEEFKKRLQETFKRLHPTKQELAIEYVITRRKTTHKAKYATSKVKEKDEHGFEEQDWLKCMDEFADIMQAVEQYSSKFGPKTPVHPIRVALIDDGVKSSYNKLDNNIYAGKAGWQQPNPDIKNKKMTRGGPFRNYNSSHTGHGTVMAYYIKRVCPKVSFYVAKLDVVSPRSHVDGEGKKVTFSCDSVAEAINWAVEEEVDIISMSWSIDKDAINSVVDPDSPETRLRNAINVAVTRNILLFCANPDKGKGFPVNNTLPKSLSEDKVFCIGAATQDGVCWSKIDPEDRSCDYFLPGVELGIQVESRSRKNPEEPPQQWRKHSGSSLSCALAAGLAAMILHCSLVSNTVEFGSEKWKWLRSNDGMRQVFENIQVQRTNSRWLPVRRFFAPAVKCLDGNDEEKVQGVRTVMAKAFERCPMPLQSHTEMAPGRPKGQLIR